MQWNWIWSAPGIQVWVLAAEKWNTTVCKLAKNSKRELQLSSSFLSTLNSNGSQFSQQDNLWSHAQKHKYTYKEHLESDLQQKRN